MKRALFGGVAAIAIVGSLPGVVLAQQATQPAPAAAQPSTPRPAAQQGAGETIVVTGSRIRRDSFNSVAPLTVITSEQAQAAGVIQTGELLQQSQAAANSGQIDASFTGFVTQGGPGTSTVGLRGLGSTRTLLLINGRRVAPAGTRGQVAAVDLNTLPSAMVDRIDILKDGASSIYGSDAVAGVINIITRRNLDGLYLEGNYNGTEEGGGEQTSYAITVGSTDDQGTFLANVQYLRQNALTWGDRPEAACPEGLTTRATAASSATSNINFTSTGIRNDRLDPNTPLCFERVYGVVSLPGTNRGDIVGTDAGLPVYDIGQARFRVATNAVTPTVTTIFGQRINSVTGFTAVAPSGAGRAQRLGTQPGLWRRTSERTLISPTEVTSAYVTGSRDIAPIGIDMEMYYEFAYSDRRSSQFSVRQFFPTVSAFNPTNPWGHNPTGSVLPSVPGTATGGAILTVPTILGGRNAQPIIPATSVNDQQVNNYRFVGGLKGNFSGALQGWEWDTYFTYGYTAATYRSNTFQADRVEAALDLVPTTNLSLPGLDLGGRRWTCRENLLTPRNQGPNCVPINLFTPEALNEGVLVANTVSATGARTPVDALAYISVNDIGKTAYEITSLVGVMDGVIGKLPAGDVSASLGFEFRMEEINDQPGVLSQTGNQWGFTSAQATVGSDQIREFFGELEVPLLASVPLVERLTLNASARFTDYQSYGSDTVYKAALGWDITNWLSFRTTYGTSFRAPALFEQFLGDQSGFITVSADSDPCSSANRGANAARAANCAADGLPATFNAATSSWTSSSAGNRAGLVAETSDNLTFGLVFQNELPGEWGTINLAVDYSDITVNGATGQFGALSIATRCYDDPGFRNNAAGFCRFVSVRDAAGALQVRNPYVNIDELRQRAVDYNARYRRNIGIGRLQLDVEASQTLEFSQTSFGRTSRFEGTIGDPEWTAQFRATYDYKDWRFFARAVFVGEGDDKLNPESSLSVNRGCSFFASGLRDDNVIVGLAPECALTTVPSVFFYDASVRYRGSDWSVTFGMNNVTDEDAPIASDNVSRLGNQVLTSQYNSAYLGRRTFVRLSKDF